MRTSYAGGDDGIRSQRELRALVAVGSNSPPDCYSLPPLFESLNSHFQGIPLRYLISHGGDDGIRTHDPLLAGQVLSQLSYTPILNSKFKIRNSKLLGFAISPFPFSRKFLCLAFFSKKVSGRPKWTRTTFKNLSLRFASRKAAFAF